jgi:uncharacterized membrane protein
VPKLLAAALTAAAVLWGVAIVGAPFLLRHPTWGVPTSVVYAGASRFCHQRPERSFHLHGTQMPVCARCAGLYLSGALGLIGGWIFRLKAEATRARVMLFIAALPTAITWGLEFAGIMPFSNVARAVAALPLGAVAGCLFIRMLRYDSRLHAAENVQH